MSLAAALHWGRQCCHLQSEVGGRTCLEHGTKKSSTLSLYLISLCLCSHVAFLFLPLLPCRQGRQGGVLGSCQGAARTVCSQRHRELTGIMCCKVRVLTSQGPPHSPQGRQAGLACSGSQLQPGVQSIRQFCGDETGLTSRQEVDPQVRIRPSKANNGQTQPNYHQTGPL